MGAPTTVDEYFAGVPEEVRPVLEELRRAIRASVPDAQEKIRYGMPAVMLGGRYAVHFAAWKKHIGLYPIPPLGGTLEDEVAPLRSGKDSVNLPLSRPIDYELVSRVVARIVELRSS